MIERNFNLHLTAGHSTALVINVNQFDQGEKWIFTLYNENGTQYIPSTGAIVGIKSDGLGIINSGSVVDGKVVIMETEQMTAAVGKAVFELMIDSQTHGTANFIVLVEPKPGNNADLSESDLSLLQEAIDATSPLPTGGTVGQVLTKTASGSTWSDAGTPTQEQVADAVSDWADEHITVETGVVIDTSLSVAGAAADSKTVGDELSDLKSAISDIEEQIEGGTGSGLTDQAKQALLTMFQHVAFSGDDPTGRTYYNALYDALYPAIVVTKVTLNTNSLSFGSLNSTQQLTATTTPSGGAIAWSSSNTSVATVSATGLVTAVDYGNATITATSGGKSATCAVTIAQATVTSISANYTQSGTVYDNASLDDLKSDLVVTANWSNSTSSTVASSDYTLSGTLAVGTSTVTVSYGGKTATFNVTVTENPNISYQFTIVDGEYIPRATGTAIAENADYARTTIISVNEATEIHFPTSITEYSTAGSYSSDDNTTSVTTLPLQNSGGELDTLRSLYFAVSWQKGSDNPPTWLNEIYGTKNKLALGWESGVPYNLELVNGYVQRTGGKIIDSTDHKRTKFVDCYGATSIKFPPLTGDMQAYGSFFDRGRNYVSNITLSVTDESTITVPSNAYYFIISAHTAAMETFATQQTIPYGE